MLNHFAKYRGIRGKGADGMGEGGSFVGLKMLWGSTISVFMVKCTTQDR